MTVLRMTFGQKHHDGFRHGASLPLVAAKGRAALRLLRLLSTLGCRRTGAVSAVPMVCSLETAPQRPLAQLFLTADNADDLS